MSGLLSSQYIDLYKALSHPIRLEILDVLSESAKSVNELGRQLNKRQSNVSQHLQVLRRNHFVFSKQVGKRRIYALNPKGKTLIDYLVKYKL
jgi:ArsR family transcriptional regulator